jgi:hypothetical protein
MIQITKAVMIAIKIQGHLRRFFCSGFSTGFKGGSLIGGIEAPSSFHFSFNFSRILILESELASDEPTRVVEPRSEEELDCLEEVPTCRGSAIYAHA